MAILRKTKEEIRKIHSSRTAVLNTVYTSSDGKRYIGIEKGRLREFGKKGNEVNSGRDGTEIVAIGNYSRQEIIEQLNQVTTNKNDIAKLKALECKLLAFNIVMG